jgi:hypothetical protein
MPGNVPVSITYRRRRVLFEDCGVSGNAGAKHGDASSGQSIGLVGRGRVFCPDMSYGGGPVWIGQVFGRSASGLPV